MSDDSKTIGEVTIIPPLPWAKVRDSEFLREDRKRGQSLLLKLDVRVEETDSGESRIKTVSEIVPCRNGNGVSGYLASNMKEIMHAFPGHRFEGEFITYPEPGMHEFPTRVLVGGASVVEQMAKVTWADKK